MWKRVENQAFYGLWATTLLLLLATVAQIFLRTPIEARMGIVQKIFYFHVPSAYCMYLGAIACCVGSVGYLLAPGDKWDAVARAGAEMAVAFGLVVITTGPLWAAKAWGHLWTWDPRLTTSMLSLLIYVSYIVLRAFSGDGGAEKRFAAALGVLGAANLPIIHYSVKKWSGQHPTVITGDGGGLADPQMKLALTMAFFAFTLFAGLLLWTRTKMELAQRRIVILEEDAVDLGLDARMET